MRSLSRVPRPSHLPLASVRTEVQLPMGFADGFATTGRLVTFDGLVDGREHVALGLGSWAAGPLAGSGATQRTPLVRLHSECLTGDVFGSERCDCGPQLAEAVRVIAEAGGYLLYLRQEGRGIGLYAKLDAYVLQDDGLDTFEANEALGYGADERDYAVAVQMLRALGVERLELFGNNPDKVAQLRRHGVTVTHRVSTSVHLTPRNARYLAAKVRHGAHALDLPDIATTDRAVPDVAAGQ